MKKENELELTVCIDWRDLFSYLMYMNYSKPLGILCFIISVVCLITALAMLGQNSQTETMILMIFGIWFTLYQPLIFLMKAKRQAKNSVFAKPTKYQLDAEGFQVMQGEQTARMEWNRLWRVIVRKDCLYLMMDPVRGNIVKKQSGEDWDKLHELLQSCVPKGQIKGRWR